MDDIIDHEAESEEASLARCRELLGNEAAELSDVRLDAIRQQAAQAEPIAANLRTHVIFGCAVDER